MDWLNSTVRVRNYRIAKVSPLFISVVYRKQTNSSAEARGRGIVHENRKRRAHAAYRGLYAFFTLCFRSGESMNLAGLHPPLPPPPPPSREIRVRQGFIYLSCARSQWSHYPAETMASPIRGGLSCICRGCNIQRSRDIQLFVLQVCMHTCAMNPLACVSLSVSLSLYLCLWIFMLSGRIIRNERKQKKKNKKTWCTLAKKWERLEFKIFHSIFFCFDYTAKSISTCLYTIKSLSFESLLLIN